MTRTLKSISTKSEQTTNNIVRNVNLIEAVNMALHRAMLVDSSVVILGEDVAVNGGVFRATDKLRAEFGLKRVMDTPLAETMIAGMAIGMAAQGIRPVAEIQFLGFIFAAMEQLVGHAARMRNRTRGRLTCPLVIRAPFGGGIHAPEHHSESVEALFAHIPGLRVVVPSSPKRAYGLLMSAIQSNDPVIFLEPKRIYRYSQSEVVDNGQGLPLGKCFIIKPGKDITLITWGAMLVETMDAVEVLEKQGISCEVIDVASISPLDHETLLTSVRKTGRCCIIHEAARNCGVGAEIAANLSEKTFNSLKAPIGRVTGFDTIMPYFQNEEYYLPSVEKIMDLVRETLLFSSASAIPTNNQVV
jgi:2-oxoisovalerate dehydrogenase E1 component beta subunit